MTQVAITLRHAAELLSKTTRPFALVGGLAVSARAEPRFTRDVDVAVAVADDREAEAIVGTFVGSGYRVLAVVEQEAAGRMATVRLTPAGVDGDSAVVDLLFASSGIETEVADQADRIELLDGLTLPVARLGHLLALKLLSRDDLQRPQDLVDIRMLLTHASKEELVLAREAIGQIELRGFNRGRQLGEALDELLR